MECLKCKNDNFDFLIINDILLIRCLDCDAEYLEEELEFNYWEEAESEKNNTEKAIRLDRRKKKDKNMLGLY